MLHAGVAAPIRSDPVRPATCLPGRTLAHTTASRTARCRIQGSRAVSPVKEGFLIYLNSRK
jgi:hypothetical protein